MDEFFQKLRKIQKNERINSGLARVGDDFYHRVHRYLEEMMDTVDKDPFSPEYDLFKDAQRIATEICERREHKIADSAVMNIQRSYHLFKGKPKFDLRDTTPLNLTPEEEKFYFSLIDILRGHRNRIIPFLDKESFENESKETENVIKKKSGALEGDSSEKMVKKTSKNSSLPQINTYNHSLDNKQSISTIAPIKDHIPSTKVEDFDLKTLIIFEKLPSIIGIDQKVYGPFYPQDVIILPEPNAEIIVKTRKGRFIH